MEYALACARTACYNGRNPKPKNTKEMCPMPFSLQPDYETVKKRYDAFWAREVLDRPPVSITLPAKERVQAPRKTYASQRARWLDLPQRALEMDAAMRSTRYLYDALPVCFPNLGPEVFSAWCGCEMEFGRDTAWSVPMIEDWDRDAEKVRLDMSSPLFTACEEFTRLLLEKSRGDYIVGMTDLHPGGDHVAALRDPQNLAMDLMDCPERVEAMLSQAAAEFFAAYGVFYHMLKKAGMPITSWLPLISDGRYGIPSNDFSCMISADMFERYFLPGIVQECRFYDNSIYHLDGPGALRHLDALLSISELDAVQWVCGAGNEGFARWAGVYQKIQRAGKGVYLTCHVRELSEVFAALRPEGVWFAEISGIDGEETARAVVDRITAWR